jgi:hypothetical protein
MNAASEPGIGVPSSNARERRGRFGIADDLRAHENAVARDRAFVAPAGIECRNDLVTRARITFSQSHDVHPGDFEFRADARSGIYHAPPGERRLDLRRVTDITQINRVGFVVDARDSAACMSGSRSCATGVRSELDRGTDPV